MYCSKISFILLIPKAAPAYFLWHCKWQNIWINIQAIWSHCRFTSHLWRIGQLVIGQMAWRHIFAFGPFDQKYFFVVSHINILVDTWLTKKRVDRMKNDVWPKVFLQKIECFVWSYVWSLFSKFHGVLTECQFLFFGES